VSAARQPVMRFVAVKTAEQHSRAAVFRGGVSRRCFAAVREWSIKDLLAHIAEKTAHVLERNKTLSTLASQSDRARRLRTMPGVGPITTIAVEAFGPDMEQFKTGRNFAARLGLVARPHSPGGRERLGPAASENAATRGLTDLRTRSQAWDVRNVLHLGRQPRKRLHRRKGPAARPAKRQMAAQGSRLRR